MNRLAPYWKAVLGFVLPGAVIIGSSVTSVSDGGSHITTAEWVTALVACVVTGGSVYKKSNAPLMRRVSGVDGDDWTGGAAVNNGKGPKWGEHDPPESPA